jgi:hypothetical protein
MERLCQLVRIADLERVYDLRDALLRRGIEAEVWQGGGAGLRRPSSWCEMRLMVAERDVVYARWVLASVGFDAWPEPDQDAAELGDRALA